MSDSAELRSQIRMNYAQGRQRGEAILASIVTPEDLHKQELEVAEQLIVSDGLQQNYYQGVWHTVGKRPLSLVRIELGKALA